MPRPRLGTSAHNTPLTIRFSQQELDALDKARGAQTRPAYVRTIVRKALKDAPTRQPTIRSSPSRPAAAPAGPEFRKPERHLHHYRQTGEPIRHDKGVAIHRWECECGATKEE